MNKKTYTITNILHEAAQFSQTKTFLKTRTILSDFITYLETKEQKEKEEINKARELC